jgi:hypothetical protein
MDGSYRPTLRAWSRRVSTLAPVADQSAIAARKEHLETALADLVPKLGARSAVEVWLFGSATRDEVGPDSNLDVVAVAESDEPFGRRLVTWASTTLPEIACDLLVYTPEEWAEVRERPFFRDAFRQVRLLYAT